MTVPPIKDSSTEETWAKTEEDQELDSKNYVPTPPDGGWGWVIVFASFMIHVLADGFTYTFGIFYVYILNYYGVSKSSASWIASILVGVTLGSGPISGTLVNRYGCRAVTIAGAFIASFSLFISIYAQTVLVLYVTIGFGTGLGFGLIYLPAIVSVTSYFEKRRSFATGIAVCGSGIGTFIFSPLTEYLIESYSWKGAMIILSAIILNCVAFGALFRPLPESIAETSVQKNFNENGVLPPDKEISSVIVENNVSLADIPTIKWITAQQVINAPSFIDNLKDKITKTPQTISSRLIGRLKADGDMPRINSHSCLQSRMTQLRKMETDIRLSSSQPFLAANSVSKTFGSQGLEGRKRSGSTVSGLMNRRDIFYRGSLLNIEQYKQDPISYRSSIMKLPDFEESSIEIEKHKICGCVPCSRETRRTFSSLIDFSLFADGIFLLFILSNFCTSIGFNAPYIFIVDRALEMGVKSEKASYLLSIIGISNTVSRVLLGYISDKPWVNRLYLYNTALTCCGIATCCSNWLTGFGGQAFYAAIFGATSGAYVGLTSVVLVDLLGMEQLTNAFGLLLMFQGIASLIGPPMCGALYDMSKTYDYSFLLAGSMIAISGMMLFFIPCVRRLQIRRRAKKAAKEYTYE